MGDLIVDGARPAVEWVAALPRKWLSDSERLFLLVLACDSYDGRNAAPNRDELAQWTGHFRSADSDIAARLEQPNDKKGRPPLLRVHRSKGGRNNRHRYELLLENWPGNGSVAPDGLTAGNGLAAPTGLPVGDQPETGGSTGAETGGETGAQTGAQTGRSHRPQPSPSPTLPHQPSGRAPDLVEAVADRTGLNRQTIAEAIEGARTDPAIHNAEGLVRTADPGRIRQLAAKGRASQRRTEASAEPRCRTCSLRESRCQEQRAKTGDTHQFEPE